MQEDVKRPVMPIAWIALAELFGTALWFTPNAVIEDLEREWALAAHDLGWLTGAVQVGFLLGTLMIGLSGIADRRDASRLFATCCLIGALSNGLLPWAGGLWPAVALRLITGMALAGIYPVGMKLMVGWAPQRAGLGLSWLVGMLVIGTATPHLLAGLSLGGDWRSALWCASLLALIAGAMIWRLGEAPHLRKMAGKTSRWAGLDAFRIEEFRHAASAYFGHMWELYTLWALTPLLLATALPTLTTTQLAIGSFVLIAIGGPGCWLGGWLSLRLGSRRIAQLGLSGSAACCLLYPWLGGTSGIWAALFLALWSLLAVIDSPHFSALSARACPASLVGSALTLQNAIGFAISAASLAWLLPAWTALGPWVAWLMLPGPLIGLWALRSRQKGFVHS
ncbi:MFS transporter [Chromohalobacter canadensis]|uniref:MFS transporter n=1 Tax=Chromohalobacter canadensis TaxID=141389 RepID=UPI002410327C|nr:MFS transporter [Chromohalobacter canadensis]